MKSTAILIPARFDSERFPGKPLTMLGDVPMIVRVHAECTKTGLDTFVVTDHKAVGELFDPSSVIYTRKTCMNGTERCADALQFIDHEHIINVQGDMPDITADIINTVAESIFEGSIHTAYTDIKPELREDPNTVKVIVGNSKQVRWFGRGFKYGYHHLGIYGFDRNNLIRYFNTPQSEHEKIEKLEQLRWFDAELDEWGFFAHKVDFDGIEINTPQDAEIWNRKWANGVKYGEQLS